MCYFGYGTLVVLSLVENVLMHQGFQRMSRLMVNNLLPFRLAWTGVSNLQTSHLDFRKWRERRKMLFPQPLPRLDTRKCNRLVGASYRHIWHGRSAW
jgi:hypothetical protein